MLTTPRRSALTVVAIMSVWACTETESIIDPGVELSTARAVSGPGYTAQEVGYLPGDVQSAASGVNDLGYVVGVSYPPSSANPSDPHAFLRAGNRMIALSMKGMAKAVSGGSPIYVAGEVFLGTNTPVRWTYDPATGSVSEEIVAPYGVVADINDQGLIIGSKDSRATLWPVSGAPITIEPIAGFTRSSGRGVNNAGHASVTFHGDFPRGFLVIDDNPIELPPAAGHTMTFSGEVSEPADGFVYVSGISAANVETDYHLARWKVDIASATVVGVEARSEVSEGRGVSDGGTVPGQIETSNGTSSAIAWTLTGTIPLKPTKGGSLASADDISANGRYIVGNAAYRGFSSRGLLWTRNP